MATTKRNPFTYDFANSAIVGSKTAIKRAGTPGTFEYKELTKMMNKKPSFAVVEKEIEINPNKRVYGGLTFAVMESYLENEDAKHGTHKLDEFKEYRAAAKEMGKSVYPVCKQWFLNEYPNFKMSEGKKTARKVNLNHIKLEAAKKKNNVVAIKPAANQ